MQPIVTRRINLLTEADLDAANAWRNDPPRTDCGFPGCSGDCNQGDRECVCSAAIAGTAGMWANEGRTSWLYALYDAAFVAAVMASIFWPLGFAS